MNDSFFSVVSSDEPDKLQVRARNKAHLETVFPSHEITEWPNRDYRFRIFVDRAEVAQLIAQRLMSIDYTNFKNSVAEKPLAHAYSEVWGTMMDYGMSLELENRRGRGQVKFDWKDDYSRGNRFDSFWDDTNAWFADEPTSEIKVEPKPRKVWYVPEHRPQPNPVKPSIKAYNRGKRK
jgi:hypothetical protein